MTEAKIVTNFSRATDANLDAKAQFIITSMTGNANFTTPIPTLAVVMAARTAFDTALTAAQTKDVNKIAVKNDKRLALVLLLKQLANYVTLIANGNRTILLSSGFDLNKDGTVSNLLGDVENFSVDNGSKIGEILSKCDGVENVTAYLHGYTTDPLFDHSIWTEMHSSSSHFTHKGLDSGKKYWFRIKALGRNDQANVSSALSRIVQ